MEPPQPNICLLCYRCVEEPVPPIFAEKLWKVGWVTIALTESVCLGVFVGKMKDVNCETNILEIGVIFDMLSNAAIIVEYDVVGHESTLISALYHFLQSPL